MRNVIGYHAHIYFDTNQRSEAIELIESIRNEFSFEIGRVWDRPVGPHPVGSCQVLFTPEDFGNFVPWLMQHRGGLTIFVHGLSGDDLYDHTQLVSWLGKSYDLKIEMFEKRTKNQSESPQD